MFKLPASCRWFIENQRVPKESIITKFFLDSADVEGDLNLANNSWIKVLSSFNKDTTYSKITKFYGYAI